MLAQHRIKPESYSEALEADPSIIRADMIHRSRYRAFVLLTALFVLFCREPCLPARAAPPPPQPPSRIISLAPGITEILYALGLGNDVAGDTNYCDYPAAAKLKPHIGDLYVNYESVLALRPNLVVADAATNGSAIPRLQALHVPLLIISSNSLAQVEASIGTVGARTGTISQANRVLSIMNHKLRLVNSIKNRQMGKPPLRTLVTVGLDPLYVAGTRSFMGDMVQRGGGADLAGAVAYVPWSKEQAVASQPQAIFCDAAGKAELLRDTAWRNTPAVRLGNIFVTNDAYMRPGPRLADAAVAVATDLARAHR